MLVAIGLTGAAGVWAFVVLLSKLYYICQPSEALIFAGLRRTTGSGKKSRLSDCPWWQSLTNSIARRSDAFGSKQYDH